MLTRSLKHRYGPIGELRLELSHDLVVNRKRPRRLDGVGRLNETSILIPNGHPVFCQEGVQAGVVIAQNSLIGSQSSQQLRKPPGFSLAIMQGEPDAMTDCFYAERKFFD
jgi:hypothetical protein